MIIYKINKYGVMINFDNNIIKLNDNLFHVKILIYLEINLIQNKLLYNWANFE